MTAEQNSLDMLIRHERLIEQLYVLFAGAFPEHRAFWEGMAAEERRHAESLQGLSSTESLKKWFMTDSQFTRLAINGSIEYLERQIERIAKDDIALLEALAIANDIEEALIEKQFIRLNIAGPEEIKGVMRVLVADTQRHRKAIAEKLNIHKRETR